MSDKKESDNKAGQEPQSGDRWRAILIDRKSLKKFFNLSIEPIEGMDLTFVEIEAYEAEKQRADAIADEFKKYRREMSKDYQELEKQLTEHTTIGVLYGQEWAKDKIKALEKENQKLREALEKIMDASDTRDEQYLIAMKALK